ncbi:MAG: extracellular solute-binding protein [Chloroflexi bacterium]|nr:extracellular solute-binding protein [Chloroflexota bacterium]MCL5275354.1 extracellular solute-binding protein [Chloroflexota bacterium]
MARNISRRQLLKTIGATAIAGALAACTPPATQAPSGGATSAGNPTAAPAVSGEKVHLKWDTFRGPGTGWNEERIKTFTDANPNVEIEFRPLTGASQQDNYGKMYALFAAGDLGDICAFDPSHFQFWRAINKGLIGPIDDLVKADNLDLKQWYDQFINLQYYNGKLYGLPSWGWAGQDTVVINAVPFKAAGLALPDPKGHDTAMDTYAEWAHTLYKKGANYGLGMVYDESHLVVLTRAFNGDLIDADGKKSLLATDKNAQDALRWAYKLAVEDKVLPRPADVTNMGAALLDGKLTMYWGGSLDARNFKRGIKDASKAVAAQGLLPTRKDGKFPSQIRGGTWNMLKSTKYPQVVYQFLKHITDLQGCIGFNLKAGQGALVRPDVVAELIKQDPIHEWFIPNLQNGIIAMAPANSRGTEYTDACGQYATKMMDPNENIPFEKGLQDLHDNIQKILDMEPA